MDISNERLLQGARNLKLKGYTPQQVDSWLKSKGSSLDAMKSFVKISNLKPLSEEQKAKPSNDYSKGTLKAFLEGWGEGIESGFDKVNSGATFGLTDWLDRHGTGDKTRLAEEIQNRADREGWGKTNKLANLMAEVGGNIKGAGGKLATKIADKGYKGVKALLLNSSIGGGAYGATSSDNISELPKKVLANSTLATIFGLGSYGTGKGGMWAYNTLRPYANAVNNATQNAVERVGLGNLRDILRNAYQKGRNALETGDDNLLTFAQEARQQSPKAYQNIEKAVESFNDTQNARNSAVINDAFGNKGKYQNTDDIVKLAKEQAAPLYERLQTVGDLANKNPNITKEIVKNPFLRKEVGRVISDPLYQAEYGAQKMSPTDWRVLDQTNRSINDQINAAVRSGEADKVRLLERQKYELLNKVDDILPEYKTARGIYEAENKALRAQKIGEDALFDNNTSSEKLARTMKDMTDYEKASLKVGAREKLLNTLESRENQTMGLKKINNEQTKGKLKLVLGDKADNLINYANDEVKAMRNLNKLTKGSQTSEKQSIRDKANLLSRIFRNPTGFIGEIGDTMQTRINNASNDVLTQMLTEKGGVNMNKAIDDYLLRASRAEQLRNILAPVSTVGASRTLQIK